jgi:voltage-gated potassium channel
MSFQIRNAALGIRLWYRRMMGPFRRFQRRHEFVTYLLAILAVWVAGACVLMLCEAGQPDSEFRSLGRSLYNIAVYLFSGLDSGQPQSGAGQGIAILILVSSILLVAMFTGSFASFLVERRLHRGKKMPNHDISGHIVICNWNDKGIPIIGELHDQIVRDKRCVVVVSDNELAAELPDKRDAPEFDGVYLVKGDPASEVFLRRASAHRAHSIIILADPRDRELADAKSVLIAMAIKSLCESAGQPKTHICVEGVNPQNIEHLRRAGADEIISASDFAMMLLSQSALEHGLSKVYRDLLTVSEDTNEVYIVDIPPEHVGKTFSELGAKMFQSRLAMKLNPAILIGLRTKDGAIRVNPQGRTELQPGDRAVVIAFEQPETLI